MKVAIGWFASVVLLLAAALPAHASPVSIIASADTQIFSADGGGFDDHNRGGQGELYIGDLGIESRGLVAFDISSIPAGQTITSATLLLQPVFDSYFTGPGPARTLSVYPVLQSWIEGTNASGPGTSGVTWNSRDKAGSLSNWGTPGVASPGVDRAAAPTATVDSSNFVFSILNIDVTSDVQAWYAGADNFGWLLQADTISDGRYFQLYSKENPPSGIIYPTLVVEFEPIPEPSSLTMLALGLVGLVSGIRRRRRLK